MPNAWVYFRLPGQAPQGFTSSFETKQDIHAITEPYFLVAPFGEHAVPIALIPQTVIHQIPEENLYTHKAYSGISTSQEKYISMIEEAQRTFASGMLEKVVLSRVFFIPLARLSLNIYFEALCKAYPSCLVSAVSMEGFGTWMGASPEILFELKEEKLRTYSLAGTRVVGELAWGEKEQQEQKWVTEYIEHKLGIDGFKMLPTQTNLRMGSIEHLLTEFEKKDSQENLYQLLLKLLPDYAPTPAVGGIPVNGACNFINKHEPHQRSLYSGYWGLVQPDGNSYLYVNLRCMQVYNNGLLLYAGAGITSASIPELEWEETSKKLGLLQSLIML